MRRSYILFFFTLALLLNLGLADWFQTNRQSDAVLLENVKALTFNRGRMTTARRTAPIPQLSCVGGSAQYENDLQPDVVQCVNVGKDDGNKIQWRCEADLDTRVRFGRTTVSCEGYSDRSDPYVLQGSCGLEYTLDFTQEGKNQKYHSNSGYSHGQTYSYHDYNHYQYDGSGIGGFLFMVIVVIIVIGLFRAFSNGPRMGSYPPPSGGTYYGSGVPPPPNPYGYGTYQPGFWTGGFLGYLLGRGTGYGYGYPRTYHSSPGYYPSSGWFGHSSGSSSSPRSSSRNATSYASTSNR
jgi:hypothetical protein